jgi:hypothetical protein
LQDSENATNFSRRRWLASFPAFAIFALLREVRAAGPPAAAGRWVRRQSELALALQHGELPPGAWMDEVERLARETDLEELMAAVRASRLTPAPSGAANDPAKRYVRFLDAEGRPQSLPYGVALFDFDPENVITPHGHKHMASAHLVVDGRFRVRTFDRVRDEPGAMVIRPREDRIARVGEISTMSSERGNVHWFVPQGGRAATFDVIVTGLDAGAPDYDIKAIDPLRAERREEGLIAAPIIGFEHASRVYTHLV